jgi:hypothetical protein
MSTRGADSYIELPACIYSSHHSLTPAPHCETFPRKTSTMRMFTGPPELEDAIEDYCSEYTLPTCGILGLLRDGELNKQHNDYTWGFRIYRTTYNAPDSDARFANALEVLNDYIRFSCFKRDPHKPEWIPPDDNTASEQLWQRLRHDIVEDPELLEGASETPAKILELAKDWVHLDQKATTSDGPRYRFFLVVDDEVIEHLLRLPMPAEHQRSVPWIYSVKVYDARHGPLSEFSDDGHEDDNDEDESDSDSASLFEYPDYQGYFWCPAAYLPNLYFCGDYLEGTEELISRDSSWDATRRFVPSMVVTKYALPIIEYRRDSASERH